MTTWNAAAVERLRAMWSAGDSASVIGRALGTTRGAVIGKAHRLKLGTHIVKLSVFGPLKPPRKRAKRQHRTVTAPKIRIVRSRKIIFINRMAQMTKNEMRAFLKQAVINTGRAAC